MKRCRVAIIGLGRMGSTIDDEMPSTFPDLPYSVAAAVQQSPLLTLSAGADLLPEKREAFRQRWGVSAVYADYRQMIAREKPDLVAICTRAENHAELAVAVAEMGVRMIFCEKAMACSMAEADAVREAVRRNGVSWGTGTLRRFRPSYQKMREIIASGEIGKPTAAVYTRRRDTVMHMHIHTVDTFLYLLGDPDPVAVRGRLTEHVPFEGNRLSKDPIGVFELEVAGGIHCHCIPGGTLDFEVLCTGGSVRSENNGMHFRLRRKADMGAKWDTWAEAPFPAFERRSPTVNVLEDIVLAHREGRPTLGHVDICHKATEVCLGIVESHRRGGERVTFPLQDRGLYVWHV